MKSCRKCRLELSDENGSTSNINRGNRKFTIGLPVFRLKSKWTVLTVAFVFLLLVITYTVLKYRPLGGTALSFGDKLALMASEFHAEEPTVVNVTSRELCLPEAKTLISLERLGYVDFNHRVSRLMAIDVGARDVHYVFMNSAHVPRLFACSVESSLRAATNNSRVNAFVIHGVEFGSPPSDAGQRLMSLSSTLVDLVDLVTSYGEDRLRVAHVSLEECLEGSPFRSMDLNMRPALAKFVVQLVLLWQFGGTVLDPSVVSVRGQAYRASGSAVEYSDRIIISPVACHEFVYHVMLQTKICATRKMPFGPKTARWIVERTLRWAGRSGQSEDVRLVAEGIVCHDGMVGDRCYYVEVDHAVTSDAKSYVRGFCPIVDEATLPWFRKTTGPTDRQRDTKDNGV